MTRTQISLDPDTFDRAKDEARRRGISFAELVRRSLAETLGPREADQPWMRLAGVLESGDPEASATVDEVVYGRSRP
jgi:hypothetical protein